MKRLNLMIFFISLFLTACAIHEVDLAGLSAAQDQVFHVRSVKLDCYGMANIPSLPLLNCSRDCQLALVNNIPTADITRKLSEVYGIRIARDEAFAISINQIPFSSLMESSDSTGYEISKEGLRDFYRDLVIDVATVMLTPTAPEPMVPCFLLQNSTAGDANNIDIEYTIYQSHSKGVLGYDIEVQTSPNHTVIRHRDKIQKFDGDLDFNNIITIMRDAAVRIPSVLEHDIKAHPSATEPKDLRVNINPQTQN